MADNPADSADNPTDRHDDRERINYDAIQQLVNKQDWEDFFFGLAGFVLKVVAGLAVLYGLVRFVKWAWEG